MVNDGDKPLDSSNALDRSDTVPMIHMSLIREPMLRFVSGYAEVEFRRKRTTSGHPHSHEPFRRQEFGSEARAKSFIRDMLAGRLDQKWKEYRHIRLQSPTFRIKNGVEVIGTLESFDQAWERINFLANTTTPWSSECGQHVHTDRSSGYAPRSAMQALITSDQSIALALSCAFLLPDYICLGYKMTTQPADCVSAGFTVDGNNTWEHVVSRIRSIHCPEGIKWYHGVSLPATLVMSE